MLLTSKGGRHLFFRRKTILVFKQASLKAFTSDFDVCDKDLGIDSVSSATCIESNESVHQPNLSATVSNMREYLHGFIIMRRKGAIVASYVRYFVHFC